MKYKFMKGAARYDWARGEWVPRRPMCWTSPPFDMRQTSKISLPVLRWCE